MLSPRMKIGGLWLPAALMCVLAVCQRASAADDATAVAGAAAAAGDSTPIVYVGPSLGWAVDDGWETRSPTLLRELARQALLIAARDELGLATRDFWLGSDMPTAGADPPFELIATTGRAARLEVVRGFDGQQAVVLKAPFKVKRLETDVPEFVASMEDASRTTFVALLRAAGFPSVARDQRPLTVEKLEPPEKIAERIGELNEIAQFQALRSLHALLRAGPETPLLLGELARAYAQLGMMTELCWAPTHKVFKARALLYAQRMTRKYPGPAALDHLAFAQALSGLPGAARETLAKARAAGESAGNTSPAADFAAWHAALDAYCRMDTDALEKACDDPEVETLARLLKFLALEQSGVDTLAVETGSDLLETTAPECFRVYAGLNRLAGVGLRHAATQTALTVFAHSFGARLRGLPRMPPSVIATLGKPARSGSKAAGAGSAWKQEAAAITALLECGRVGGAGAKPGVDPAAADAAARRDDNELRWETLGLTLREIAWDQIWRRAYVERWTLGTSADAFLRESRPLANAHPYGAFLRLYLWEQAEREKAVGAVLKLKPVGVEFPGIWIGLALKEFKPARGEEFINLALRNCDETAFELTQKMTCDAYERVDQTLDRQARRLLAVSPHSPIAQARLIERAFDDVRDRADAWEQTAGRHPLLAMAFAKHYATRDPERAERLLRSAAALSKELDAYLQLAEIYKQQGKEARWLSTLEDFLKQPAYGLEHAQVQVKIADHYIDKGEWAEAQPYAEAAAESYSAWGLSKAGNVSEALGEWESAENYYQAVAERYRGENLAWYFFCKRTGQGNAAAARAVAEAFVASQSVDASLLGLYYLLDKQSDRALQSLEKVAAADENPIFLMEIAMLADREKQFERRDATLRRISALGKSTGKKGKGAAGADLVELADLFINDLKQDGKAEFDLEEVEKRFTTKNPPGQSPQAECAFYLFLGWYLDRGGKTDAAIDQWKQCMACPKIDLDTRTLAGAALVEHGVHPTDYDNPLLKNQPGPNEP